MPAVLLALASSIGYGAADFVGGLASRETHVLRVVAIAAPAALVLSVVLLPFVPGDWSIQALVWGAGSGFGSAAAYALVYRSLALGPMSVVAPVTALLSAAIPVGVGIGEGERLEPVTVLGLVLTLIAIPLVGGGGGDGGRASRRALTLSVLAGAAIAVQLVCLKQAPASSGAVPLLAGSVVSSGLLVAAFLRERPVIAASADRRTIVMALGSGVLSGLSNFAFLVAARTGDLAVVAVITALYPGATVLLARALLRERIARPQAAGLVAAAVAVALLAAG